MTKVTFVFGAMLALCASALANFSLFQFNGTQAVVLPAFQGNPNVTITAITPSIAAARTSCQTPCFVQVSGSATTATGTSRPYEDLSYTWNFGDPAGTETFNQPINLAGNKFELTAVNPNTEQTGPEAAYVYRTAGTYTVTMTVLGKNGGSYTSTSTTQNITVTTYSASGGDWYFDSAAAGGGNGSIGTPFNALSDINTKAGVANAALHLKKGSTWSGSTGLSITASPLRIDAYGSGASPAIVITSGSNDALTLTNSSARSDIVFSGVTFQITGGTASEVANIFCLTSSTNAMSDIWFDNSVINATTATIPLVMMQYTNGGGTHNAACTRGGLWGGTVTNSQVVNGSLGIYSGPNTWFSVVGISISGAGTNNTLDHHIYPETQLHSLYRYISFGSGPNRSFNINTNYDIKTGATPPEYAEFVLISDNDMTGTLRAHDASNGTNDPSSTRFRNFVTQRNAIHSLTGNGVIFPFSIETLTTRYNLLWNNTGGDIYTPASPTIFSGTVYFNKMYVASGTTGGDDTSLMAFTQGTFSQQQVITDNVSQDMRANANVIQATVTQLTGSSSVINRNQWYTPNDTTPFWNAATPENFATWQGHGFDAAGSTANPSFADPANGNFGP